MCPDVKEKIREFRELVVRLDVLSNELVALVDRPPEPMYPMMDKDMED